MFRSNTNAKFLSLSIVLLAVAVLFTIPASTATSQGSVQSADSVGRYQVSAFAYPPTEESSQAMYGAYIIDTETGKVWISLKTKAPSAIGKVE